VRAGNHLSPKKGLKLQSRYAMHSALMNVLLLAQRACIRNQVRNILCF
jgi:hypothetical protein